MMSASVGAHIIAQVYMHPHQMAHCLQDAAVMELVEQGHLKLIYIDSAPEIFTSCKKVKRSGSFNSSVAADEQVSCTSRSLGFGPPAHVLHVAVGPTGQAASSSKERSNVTKPCPQEFVRFMSGSRSGYTRSSSTRSWRLYWYRSCIDAAFVGSGSEHLSPIGRLLLMRRAC